MDGELSKTSKFGRTLDTHLLKLAPLEPTHSDLAFGISTSSTSVYALPSLSYEWILILSKVLVMYLFKYILYFPVQTIDRIFVVERKKMTIFDQTSNKKPINL